MTDLCLLSSAGDLDFGEGARMAVEDLRNALVHAEQPDQ